MRLVLLTLICLAGLVAGGVAYAAPHVGAYLCPPCYGFRAVAAGVLVDKAASERQIESALTNLKAANERVLRFYPERNSQPKWIFCLSEACWADFGKGPLAMTYINAFVFVYPGGATVPVMAHELSHAELHERVGILNFMGGAIPAWFDEGLAVYISRDSRYLNMQGGQVIGCDKNEQEPPSDARTFRHLGATDARRIYTASACRVVDWLAKHGGMDGVIAMEKNIRRGGSFSE